MSRRLFPFLLAVVVAFVFTGRMEAAASHCRGAIAPAPAAMDMSMLGMEGMDMSPMPDCHGAEQPAKHHSPANDPCECLALLTADFPVIDAAKHSARIAPFIWQATPTMNFASLEAAPDNPPPRA